MLETGHELHVFPNLNYSAAAMIKNTIALLFFQQ